MKKLAWQTCLLTVILILVCVIARISTQNVYTSYVPVAYAYQDSQEFSVEHTGDGPGEMSFEQPRPDRDYVQVRTRPEKPGNVEAEIRNERGDVISVQSYRVGLFGTIYDYATGGFTGDGIVMAALTAFFMIESLLLFLAFLRAKGPSFYAYSTIYTAGFSIFMLLTGLTLLVGTIRHMRDPGSFTMLSVYSLICSAGYHFMIYTAPLVLIFAVALTVSNIELLRHERPRFQNALGILTSLLMVGGVILAVILFTADFSGSEQSHRIWLTVQNVYCTAYTYFECMLLGAIICGLKAAKHIPEGIVDYIVVLGCGFRKDGTLPPLLKGRVDRAISFWKEQKEKGKTPVIIPSGGQGPHEVMAESEAMRRYLVGQEIPEEFILPENQSRNTYQNMEFSKKLIGEKDPDARVVFSTTNYHVFRSGVWASLAGLKAEGIGSQTKWWFWPNAFIRECVGLLVNRWKQEILLLIVLAVLFGGLSMVL